MHKKMNNKRSNNLILFIVLIKNKLELFSDHAKREKIKNVTPFLVLFHKNISPFSYNSYRILHISYISYVEIHSN